MIALVLLLTSAFALDAEGERVGEELVRYAVENKWGAVEDQYVRMVAQHPTMITDEIHRLGAQAARFEGRLMVSVQRLQRVHHDSPERTRASEDLGVLERTTGLVMVNGSRSATLVAVPMPFAPELRKAVQVAANELAAEGHFVGLLPAGDYTLNGTALKVLPGFEWQVLTGR